MFKSTTDAVCATIYVCLFYGKKHNVALNRYNKSFPSDQTPTFLLHVFSSAISFFNLHVLVFSHASPPRGIDFSLLDDTLYVMKDGLTRFREVRYLKYELSKISRTCKVVASCNESFLKMCLKFYTYLKLT